MKTLTKLLLFLAVGMIVPSCATKKKRSDLSMMGKLYHNTTSKFNGYYNAGVLMEESTLALNDQQKDNYNQILDIYEYEGAPNTQSVAPELDKAMEKVSVVISLHRQSWWTDDCYLLIGQAQYLKRDFEAAEETFKFLEDEFKPENIAKKKKKKKKRVSKKERKKIEKEREKKREEKKKERKKTAKEIKKQKEKERKARIKAAKKKKKERERNRKKGIKNTAPKKPSAETNEIKKTEPVKKQTPIKKEAPKKQTKEEEEKDSKEAENYFMKHRPVYQEGQLWLARTLVKREKYNDAERIYNSLASDPKTFTDVKRQLAPARASAALEQEKFDEAIEYLEQSVKMTKDRGLKARYTYIIAQLHDQAKRSDKAYAYFNKVLKYRPEYDMVFGAKMQIAKNSWSSGKETPAVVKKKLSKMLKDGKNVDYKDQIYYTMAQIDLQNNDKKSAISNLVLSAKNSTINKSQRAESYYQLADLHFNDEMYVEAKLYYDSTMQFMPKDDDRFENVQKYSLNLTEIAKNMQLITLQDSLLRISKMSDEEKRDLALKIKKEEEEKRLAAAAAAANADANSPAKNAFAGNNVIGKSSLGRFESSTRTSTGGANIGNFFAYDIRSVKRGKKDFIRKWNNRPLVDNWRLSSLIEEDLEDSQTEDGEEISSGRISEEEIANILADIPTSAADIQSAHKSIERAFFELGKLFREKLENYKKAIDSHQELFSRYPETEFEMNAWYYLYLNHTDLSERIAAKKYYDLILAKYPETTYARVLKDPDHFKHALTEEQKLNQYYDETYKAFQQDNHALVLSRINDVDSLFNSAAMQPKFALLGAMSKGKLEGKDQYIKSLKGLIAKFPKTQEEKRAKEILRLLGDDSQTKIVKDGQNDSKSNGLFKAEADKLHYLIIAFQGSPNISEAKSEIGDYHRKYFSNKSLRVSNIVLGDLKDKMPMIVIRRFKNQDEVMDYYRGVALNKKDFLSDDFTYQLYPVTQNNYRQILKARSLNGYQNFFKENYLN